MGILDRIKTELIYLRGALRTLRATTPIMKNPTRVFPVVVEELAERYGERPALLSDRERFTYRELDARANRYARWALANGVKKGDVICLLMLNRPEYLAIWIGITRIGGIVALLNTNLSGPSLGHCVAIVKARHVIVGADLADAYDVAAANLAEKPTVWVHGASAAGHARIDEAVETLDAGPIPPADRPAITVEDPALFIYTSGTTGLPKAANFNHYRLMGGTHGYRAVMELTEDDRMYDTLPMYHSNGGVLATGATLVAGGAVVIREKFSAREFWDDIVRWDCTCFFYIGELCRYLVNSPTSPSEAKHRIRVICGNGLRPDVWDDFVHRFRIPNIREFYAATEGNVVMFNFDSKPGAVGRIPKWAERRFIVKVARFDVETEEPVRGPDGLCVEAEYGEPGEVLGKIVIDPSKPANRFEGYVDKAATAKKVLHDAFEKGDAWFRTGDLMRRDALGYYYFVDRIGDTFRWKGENVATSEVSEAITVFPGVKEANVYGVSVPGRDGRAGMAAVVVDGHLDLEGLRAHLAKQLADYARPVFLRILPEIEITGTFKQKKVDLRKEGFDPAKIEDPIYFNDPEQQRFVRVDEALYARIGAGQVRL